LKINYKLLITNYENKIMDRSNVQTLKQLNDNLEDLKEKMVGCRGIEPRTRGFSVPKWTKIANFISP
jgi:hypothetical protein